MARPHLGRRACVVDQLDVDAPPDLLAMAALDGRPVAES
jgi:hypothetical protein